MKKDPVFRIPKRNTALSPDWFSGIYPHRQIVDPSQKNRLRGILLLVSEYYTHFVHIFPGLLEIYGAKNPSRSQNQMSLLLHVGHLEDQRQ